MTHTEDECRLRFEEWRKQLCSDLDVYEDFCGHSAWLGWQAAWNSRVESAKPAEGAEQPDTCLVEFNKWAVGRPALYSHAAKSDARYIWQEAWQASRASLLAELESPEMVEEVAKAMVAATGDYSLRVATGNDIKEAQAALSVVRKNLESK